MSQVREISNIFCVFILFKILLEINGSEFKGGKNITEGSIVSFKEASENAISLNKKVAPVSDLNATTHGQVKSNPSNLTDSYEPSEFKMKTLDMYVNVASKEDPSAPYFANHIAKRNASYFQTKTPLPDIIYTNNSTSSMDNVSSIIITPVSTEISIQAFNSSDQHFTETTKGVNNNETTTTPAITTTIVDKEEQQGRAFGDWVTMPSRQEQVLHEISTQGSTQVPNQALTQIASELHTKVTSVELQTETTTRSFESYHPQLPYNYSTQVASETTTQVPYEFTTRRAQNEISTQIQHETTTQVPYEFTTRVPYEITTLNPIRVSTEFFTQGSTKFPNEISTKVLPTEMPFKIPTQFPTQISTQVSLNATNATDPNTEAISDENNSNSTLGKIKGRYFLRGSSMPKISTQLPIQASTQSSSQVSTQPVIQVPTQTPSQASSQIPTQISTQISNQISTQIPNQISTQVPTQVPVQIISLLKSKFKSLIESLFIELIQLIPPEVSSEVATQVLTEVLTEVFTEITTQNSSSLQKRIIGNKSEQSSSFPNDTYSYHNESNSTTKRGNKTYSDSQKLENSSLSINENLGNIPNNSISNNVQDNVTFSSQQNSSDSSLIQSNSSSAVGGNSSQRKLPVQKISVFRTEDGELQVRGLLPGQNVFYTEDGKICMDEKALKSGLKIPQAVSSPINTPQVAKNKQPLTNLNNSTNSVPVQSNPSLQINSDSFSTSSDMDIKTNSIPNLMREKVEQEDEETNQNTDANFNEINSNPTHGGIKGRSFLWNRSLTENIEENIKDNLNMSANETFNSAHETVVDSNQRNSDAAIQLEMSNLNKQLDILNQKSASLLGNLDFVQSNSTPTSKNVQNETQNLEKGNNADLTKVSYPEFIANKADPIKKIDADINKKIREINTAFSDTFKQRSVAKTKKLFSLTWEKFLPLVKNKEVKEKYKGAASTGWFHPVWYAL